MNSKLTKLATAAFLSLCTAAPALAGSVTQPGETVGLNAGAPLDPGWYAINTVDWGCRNTTPTHTCTGLTIPVVAWSTPWTFLGARFQLLAAWPAVEAGVQRSLSVTQTLICQAPTLTVCTTRRCSANWPGTSAMDGALATCLELISTTIARWRLATPRSISGLH